MLVSRHMYDPPYDIRKRVYNADYSIICVLCGSIATHIHRRPIGREYGLVVLV